MPGLVNILLNILYPVLLLAGIIGGYFALKSALAKSESEIQERVRKALEAENVVLQRRVKTVEGRLSLLINWFAKQGVVIEFDGDALTIKDTKNGITTVHPKNEP